MSEKIQTKYTLCKGIDDLYPYEVELPPPPPEKEIINYGLPKSEQTFKRTFVPKEIMRLGNMLREDAIKVVEANPEMQAFIEKMWYKFTYGEWQYINGKALHISPTYWFYLNFWKMDVGLPQFRYDLVHFASDLWEFMWWDYVVQPSPVCYGEIQGSKRRGGKSYKALCKAYKRIISLRNAGACIQSKTELDATKAFTEKMVMPWTQLPFFFRPQYSNSSYPKKEGLQFSPRTKKTNDVDFIDPDHFLFSHIVPLPSTEKAADGYKWYAYVGDEEGKTTEANVWERHTIVKPCLTQDGEVIGKALITTTVEDMDKGGGMLFWYKWRMSDRDPNKPKKDDITVNEEGETVSGLWQWFCPSRCNEVFDKFGCAIVDGPTIEQRQWLRDVKKDRQFDKGGRQRVKERVEKYKSQLDRHREMRKYPENVRDMFLSASGICYFDLGILNERLKYFAMGYPKEMATEMTFGNMHWKDGVFGGEVEFLPTEQEDAKFWISYLPRAEHRNKWKIDEYSGKKIPANWHKFCAGADAFKFDTQDVINKKDMSDGSMHIYAEYDINIDLPNKPPEHYVTDDICVEYLALRNKNDTMTVDDLCEDYLKACIFYGCKLFPEKNNPEVVSYFKRHGFEYYLQFDMQFKSGDGAVFLQEKGGGGANTDTKSVQSMFKVVQRYVKEKGLRCKFYRTLDQLKHVTPDPGGMNPYDLFVSLATCLRVVQEFNPIRLKEDSEEKVDVSDISGLFSAGVPSEMSAGNNFGQDSGRVW